MKVTTIVSVLLVVFALGDKAPAQLQVLSGEATPNPAMMGSTIALTVESTQPVALLSGCGIISVHQGSPTGPSVYAPFLCPLILINVAPGFPATVQWNGQNNAGNPVPAGTYYMRVDYDDPNTGQSFPPAFFPVRIDDPSAPLQGPTLALAAPANLGSTLGFTLDAPFAPLATYIVAASFTTNQGLSLGPNQHLALDQDFLFDLSFPFPNPLLFANTFGSLDVNGHSGAPSLSLPSVPSLVGGPIAFQGVVIVGGNLFLANPITTTLH